MSFFKEWKFRIIAIVAVLSLWLVLFGAEFKKGIDIAGGVELTYQIDFSKYKEAYNTDVEYSTAVQNAKNIIKTNITKRVNGMGVGDAEVKLLKVGEKEYIVVKVWVKDWGDADVEAAKATIGKTVELEFKLPNEAQATPEELAARQITAEEVLATVIADPSIMKQLAEGRQSEDIYYEAINRAYDQLPQVYQDNTDILKNLSGVANQVIQWVYGQQTDLSGNAQDIKWFFIIKSNGLTTIPSAQVSPAKLTAVNEEFNTTSTESYELNTSVTGTVVATWVTLVWSDLVIADVMYPWLVAYRASAYLVPLSSWFTTNTDLIASITGALSEGNAPATNSGYSLILDDQWIDLTSLESLQTGLTIASWETLKIVDTANGTVILSLTQTKSALDNLQMIRTIQGSTESNRNDVVTRLTSDNVYNIEQIFVRDSSSWKPAVDTKTNKLLNGAYFQSAATIPGQAWLPVVTIQFNAEGADIFCNITSQIIGQQMAIFVWGRLVTNPIIRDKICGGTAQIDGTFTDQTCTDPKNPLITYQAEDTLEWASCLVANLNEWALPAPLILSNEATLAPTLGENAWIKAGYATVVGLVLVFGLLWYMYWLTKSSLALLSLVIYLIVLLAFVKLTNYALSLSGIAAIILNIGMWVDSSILILERLKEELGRGINLRSAIMTAYDRSWAPILDGNVSSGLIGFMMALVWSDVFQGFGFMMVVNIIILLAVAVPLTKYLLLLWAEHKE